VEVLKISLPDYLLEQRGITTALGDVPLASGMPFALSLACHPTSHIGQPPTRPQAYRIPDTRHTVRTVRFTQDDWLADALAHDFAPAWRPALAPVFGTF